MRWVVSGVTLDMYSAPSDVIRVCSAFWVTPLGKRPDAAMDNPVSTIDAIDAIDALDAIDFDEPWKTRCSWIGGAEWLFEHLVETEPGGR